MKFLNHNLFTGDITVSGTTTLSTATGVTRAASDNSTHLATTAFVKAQGYSTTDSYVSSVSLNGNSLDFTGTNSAFTGSIDLSSISATPVKTVYETVKNVSGAIIYKGTPLAVVAGQTSGNVSDVIPADAADPAKMPAIFIANQNIADEAEGEAVLFGNLTGVDTSAYASGTTVYVAPGGGWTATKPVHPNLIQNLGVITKQHPTNGAGIVTGVGRANSLPNLTAGKLWVGSATYPIESTTVHVDEANGRVGIGTTSPLAKTHIKASSAGGNSAASGTLIVEQGSAPSIQLLSANSQTQTIKFADPESSQIGRISYSHPNDAMFFVTNNSEKVRITSDGNVGIGTTAPTDPLTIGGGQTGLSINSATTGDPYVRWRLDGTVYTDAYVDRGTGNFIMGPSVGAALVFKTNATEKVRITSAGNVGIGTTSPQTKLNIDIGSGGANGTAAFRIGGVSNYPSLELGIVGNYGGMVRSYGNDLHYYAGHWRTVGTAATEDHSHYWYTSKNGSTDWSTPKMELDHNGNLGIGTTSPGALLHINGSGDAIRVTSTNAGAGGAQIDLLQFSASPADNDTMAYINMGGYYSGTTSAYFSSIRTVATDIAGRKGELQFWTNNGSTVTQKVVIDAGGNVGIGVTDPEKKLEVKSDITYDGILIDTLSAPEIVLRDRGNSDTLVGTGRHGLDSFHIDTYSGNAFFIKGDTRNVGIGTTSPGNKLHVVGSATVSTSILVPGASTANALMHRFGTSGGSGSYTTLDVIKTADTSGDFVFMAYAAGVAASTSSPKLIFGHYDATPSNGAVMTIDTSNERVGIGTTAPISALHILGNQFRIEDNDPTITLKRNVASAFGGHIDWLTNDNTLGFQIANNALVSAAVLEFNHSGVNRMVIKSDGNVGIGTTAPTEKLEVAGDVLSTGASPRFKAFGNSATGYPGLSLSNTTQGYEVIVRGNDANKFQIRNTTASTDLLTITSAGNVGIGTTSPTQKLDVVGTIRSQVTSPGAGNGDVYAFAIHEYNGNNGRLGLGLHDTGDAFLGLYSDGGVTTRIDSNGSSYFMGGNVGIGTTSPGFKLTLAAASATDSDILLAGMTGVSNGFTVRRVSSSFVYSMIDGGLGINNAAPTQALHVTGNLRVTGAYYDSSNSAGTSGQILKSTGTGTDWVTLSEITGVDGTGTANYIAKWSDTDTITNSQVFDNGTNVGIGTTSPSAKLEVSKADNAQIVVRQSDAPGSSKYAQLVLTHGTSYFGANDKSYQLVSNALGTGEADFTIQYWNGSAYNERLRVTSAGNVGIGTTSPTYKLDVNGSIRSSGVNGLYIDASTAFGDNSGGGLSILNLGSTRALRIVGSSNNGWGNILLNPYGANVGIGTTEPNRKLHVESSGVIADFKSTTTQGLVDIIGTSNQLRIGTFSGVVGLAHGTGTSPHITIASGGNVGIGTTSPVDKLHVANGNISITTGYSFGLSAGDTNWRIGRNIIAETGNYLTNSTMQFIAANAAGQGWQFINDDALTILEIDAYQTSGNVWLNVGNFGVCVGLPQEKIHVAGRIRIDGASTSTILETGNATAGTSGVVYATYDIATTYGVIVDYVIYDTNRDNMRTGTFSAVWNTGITNYNDISTVDIGDTSVVTLTSQINGTDVELIVTGDTQYTVKFNSKLIK